MLWQWRMNRPTPLRVHDVPRDLAERNIRASQGDRSYTLAVNVPARTVETAKVRQGGGVKAMRSL